MQAGPQSRTGQDGHLNLEAGKEEGNGIHPSCSNIQSPFSLPSQILSQHSGLAQGHSDSPGLCSKHLGEISSQARKPLPHWEEVPGW